MVGLAIAIMRGAAPGEAISLALEAGRKVMVPMAPAVGLLLVECMYESYNERFGITHERIDTSQWATEVSALLSRAAEDSRLGVAFAGHTGSDVRTACAGALRWGACCLTWWRAAWEGAR